MTKQPQNTTNNKTIYQYYIDLGQMIYGDSLEEIEAKAQKLRQELFKKQSNN